MVDDIVSTDPFQPRGIEVRGRAEAIEEPEAVIRIHPERIVAWGMVHSGDHRACRFGVILAVVRK